MDAEGVVLIDRVHRGGGGFAGGSALGLGGSLRGGGGRIALNFINQAINFINYMVDRLREWFIVFHLLDLAAEKVHSLEQHIEQIRPGCLRDYVHALLPDDEEHILNPVGHRHQRAELHHSGRALDRVHDTEYLIDAVLGERIGLFRRQQNTVQLL